jgi:hypothetical protein
MDTGVLVQVLLGGLAEGAILGLVALGFSLVAGTVRVLHFAYGEISLAAIFAGVLGVLGRAPIAAVLAPVPSVLFVLLIVAAGAVLSGVAALLVVLPNLPNASGGGRRAGDVVGWIAGGVGGDDDQLSQHVSGPGPHALIEVSPAAFAITPLDGEWLDRMRHPVRDLVTVAVAVGDLAVDRAQHPTVVLPGPAAGEHRAPELLCRLEARNRTVVRGQSANGAVQAPEGSVLEVGVDELVTGGVG